MPMKRGDRPEKEKEMLQKIRTEYELFYYKTLSRTPQEIYHACKRICFFECVYEYFQYKEEISEDFINATGQRDRILEELWEIYLKHEYLGMDTWEEIEELLEVYARKYATESKCKG